MKWWDLGVHWKDWHWSLNSNTLATSCEELTHWKRPWCWEGLGAGGEGDNRGWDGWMASPTRWAWVWVNSGSWWWTRRPGVLRFMGSQRVGHNWATELNWAFWVFNIYGTPETMVFPFWLVGTGTIPCLVPLRGLFLLILLSTFSWACKVPSHTLSGCLSVESSVGSLCRSLELSVQLSHLWSHVLKTLDALVSPDSQPCLHNSAVCQVSMGLPYPHAIFQKFSQGGHLEQLGDSLQVSHPSGITLFHYLKTSTVLNTVVSYI